MRQKIDDEIIVDCYDQYEVNMSWYYFFERELDFPFEAEITLKNRKGEKKVTTVDVLGMATEDGDFNGSSDYLLEVSPKGSELVFETSLSKLKHIKGSQEVKEAFELWNFWKKD